MPTVKIKNDLLTFDFSVYEYEQPFKPIPQDTIVKVDRNSLKNAIEKVKEELGIFSLRLLKINTDEHLGIDDIDRLLIWDNPNQP